MGQGSAKDRRGRDKVRGKSTDEKSTRGNEDDDDDDVDDDSRMIDVTVASKPRANVADVELINSSCRYAVVPLADPTLRDEDWNENKMTQRDLAIEHYLVSAVTQNGDCVRSSRVKTETLKLQSNASTSWHLAIVDLSAG